MTQQLQSTIETAWENRASLSPDVAPKEVLEAVEHVIAELNTGKAARGHARAWASGRCTSGSKAVLLSFRLKDNELIQAGNLGFYDKVPTKFGHLSAQGNGCHRVRVVPSAVARRGSFIARGAILMPSYVNIGAYVDEGTMVDTWATVAVARKWARTCISRAAWAWAACWKPPAGQPHHHRRTTASSAPAPKSSKASSSKRTRSSRMGVYLGQSTPFMTARPAT